MSYLHCPTCSCAYNVSQQPACPRCGARAGAPADPTEDVVAAVDQLARAMKRATPAELAAAERVLDARSAQLALPASTTDRATIAAPAPSLIRAVRAALAPPVPAPAPVPAPPPQQPVASRGHALLTTIALAVLTRLTPPPRRLAAPAGPSLRAWATTRLRAPVTRARALFAR